MSKPLNLVGIDALRGVAASVVVAYHAARHLDKTLGAKTLLTIFQFGHAGVDLFFVLSGFIIYFAHSADMGNPGRLRNYFWRRLTRVFPVYWVALFVTIFLIVLGGHGMPSILNVLFSMSLLPSRDESLLGVAWTLQYEIVFYAVFCLLILNKRLGLLTFSFWLSCIVLSIVSAAYSDFLPGSIFGMYNVEFFFGMFAGYLFGKNKIAAPFATFLVGCGLFGVAAIAEDLRIMDGYANMARLAYGLPALLIVGGLAEWSRRSPINIGRTLRILGASSYSIYLFQFVFIGIFWKLWLKLDFQGENIPLCFLVLLSSGIGGGVVTHYLVERPVMQLSCGKSRASQRILPVPQLAGVADSNVPTISDR